MIDAKTWDIRAVRPRIPPNQSCNPLVLVDLIVGQEWAATVGIQVLKNSGMVMRMPITPGGEQGLTPCPELWRAMAEAAKAAVMRHPDTRAHLESAPPKRAVKVGHKRRNIEAMPRCPRDERRRIKNSRASAGEAPGGMMARNHPPPGQAAS